MCDAGGSWVYLQVKLRVMQGVAGCHWMSTTTARWRETPLTQKTRQSSVLRFDILSFGSPTKTFLLCPCHSLITIIFERRAFSARGELFVTELLFNMKRLKLGCLCALERVRVYVLFLFVCFSFSEIEKSYVCVTMTE